jgi:16S rRNA (uracil1498-N3)-methyltransferase
MKRRPRFAIAANDLAGGEARISGSELHHMRDVLRLGAGDEVELCGHDGTEYRGRVAAIGPNAAIIALDSAHHNDDRAAPRLITATGLIKAARMDLLVEKAAELNASELWPLACARSVVRDPGLARIERWRRLAAAAVKQSLRSHPMEIRPPMEIKAMVGRMPTDALAITCVAGSEPLGALLRRTLRAGQGCPSAIVLACGPEGDFSSEELLAMREGGFAAAGLGRNRLRSETAAIAALSITAGVLYEVEKEN